MKPIRAFAAALAACALPALAADAPPPKTAEIRDSAPRDEDAHRFSTLITAQQVRDLLGSEEGIDAAAAWCRAAGVTKVYVEVFRDGYQARRESLIRAKERLAAAGLEVSGCITTTRLGKASTGWKIISCFTDEKTQAELQSIVEYAAELFDEIMLDDFYFTDCACAECDAARKAKTIAVGGRRFSAAGDAWEDYRCELMVRLSQERVLAPARRVNPEAKLIIKYPQWYDRFHERGYDVARETAAFDRIWVGTETGDYDDARWGGTPQYEAFFIRRWLGGIGGGKCGGGWFDPYGTTAPTYLEQARQTVLGGARESLLFCYGALLKETGPKNVELLRANRAELLAVAGEVRRRPMTGIAAYKPPNSHPENEPRVFDFAGMLGLPLAPCHEFPGDAPAAFFSLHALKDQELPRRLAAYVASNRPVIVTDGLARRLAGVVDWKAPLVRVLPVGGNPAALLALPQAEIDALRAPALAALSRVFRAPARVALYLFADGSHVLENFNDTQVLVELDGVSTAVPARAWRWSWK